MITLKIILISLELGLFQQHHTIVNRRKSLETRYNYNISHYLCFCSGLCRNKDLYRHVPIVFLPN